MNFFSLLALFFSVDHKETKVPISGTSKSVQTRLDFPAKLASSCGGDNGVKRRETNTNNHTFLQVKSNKLISPQDLNVRTPMDPEERKLVRRLHLTLQTSSRSKKGRDSDKNNPSLCFHKCFFHAMHSRSFMTTHPVRVSARGIPAEHCRHCVPGPCWCHKYLLVPHTHTHTHTHFPFRFSP